MGDIADMMLDGDMCQGCGEILDGDGYPQFCNGCQNSMSIDKHGNDLKPKAKKVNCPICKKPVKENGLDQHKRDVHNLGE